MKTATLVTLVVLSATVSASPVKRAALFTGKEYEITKLKLQDPSNSKGNVTISFNVHDPDPLTNATASCKGSWPHGSNLYPQGTYVKCNNNNGFAWNFESYTSFENFTLNAQHSFRDPSVGQPPYDHVTTFARANVDSTVLACDVFGGDVHCAQKKGTVIKAPIYAAIA